MSIQKQVNDLEETITDLMRKFNRTTHSGYKDTFRKELKQKHANYYSLVRNSPESSAPNYESINDFMSEHVYPYFNGDGTKKMNTLEEQIKFEKTVVEQFIQRNQSFDYVLYLTSKYFLPHKVEDLQEFVFSNYNNFKKQMSPKDSELSALNMLGKFAVTEYFKMRCGGEGSEN